MSDSVGQYLNEIGMVPLLNAQEERELSQIIEAGADARARERARVHSTTHTKMTFESDFVFPSRMLLACVRTPFSKVRDSVLTFSILGIIR